MATAPRATDRAQPRDRGRRTGRTAQIISLLVLTGVGAELLAAYSDTTGSPGGIAFSLLFFAALYGAPALLVRELARRAGWGWPALLLLFLALGITQACLIDQALFSTDYQGYDGWEVTREATLIPVLGISAFNAHNFLGGHVIFSFGAPVALAEAWRPAHSQRSWLGPIGIGVAAVCYLGAAYLIRSDPESQSASPTQVVVSVLAVTLCLLSAWLVGRAHRRRAERAGPGRAPRVGVVLVGSLVLAALAGLAEETWAGVGLGVGVTVLLGGLVWWTARRPGWGPRHAAAVGLAFLLVRGGLAFTYFPLAGEVEPLAKYAHNVVMLLVVLLAGWYALRPPGQRSTSSVAATTAVGDGAID